MPNVHSPAETEFGISFEILIRPQYFKILLNTSFIHNSMNKLMLNEQSSILRNEVTGYRRTKFDFGFSLKSLLFEWLVVSVVLLLGPEGVRV